MLALMVIFELLTSSNAAVTFSLVVPDGSISGPLGSSVVLPCTLSPSLDCKGYKISWYRPNNDDNPVLLYEDLKVQENAGDPQYRGRVSLVGDLQKGNVSLKLENLTLADRGEYVCFVNAYQWFEKASVFTTVTVVGSLPYLSLAEVGDQVNVTCASDGWSPQPTLTWRDKTGKELKNISEYYLKDSEGLVSVRSWLMFSPSDSEWISCSVGLSDQEMKEGRVFPLKTLQSVSSGWNATFIILLLIFVLGMSLLVFLIIKGHVWRKPSKPPKTDEEAHLFGKASPSDDGVTQPLGSAPGAEDTRTGERIKADSASKEKDLPEQGKAGLVSGDEGPGTGGETQGKLISESDSASDTTNLSQTQDSSTNNTKSNKEKERADWNMMLERKGSAPGAEDTRTGERIKDSASKEKDLPEQGKAGSASGDEGPGTGGETQGKLISESDSASDTTNLSQTQDSNTNNTKRNKEKEGADWKKMLNRKVAIQTKSMTDLGVLFKERIRAGQYYWQVNGLTDPSLRTYDEFKCPESWYVGVISETVLKNKLQLSPQNCWVLHYDKEKGFYVNDPSLTPVPVKDWFFRLGVFIDCEKNTLSFYNYDKSSHLYTFYNVDCTQPLVPVVFPGLRPQYSLEISKLSCVKCDELYQQ